MARRIEQEVLGWPGVRAARANERTGRILIEVENTAAVLAHFERGVAFDGAPAPRPEHPPVPREPASREAPQRTTRFGFSRRPSSPAAPAVPGLFQDPESAGWHALSVEEVLAALAVDERGLAQPEAARRLKLKGPNRVDQVETRSHLAILLAQLANLPTGILLGAALASGLMGDVIDAGAILAVVALNAAIGYVIESHNEDLIASWRRLEAGEARVVRDGLARTIPAEELVPGDLLLLLGGDVLPADARVVKSKRLSSDEAPLTGESEPQLKGAAAVAAEAPLAERASMVYAGTTVAGGRGRAIVVATGRSTVMARVRQLVEEADSGPAPLERNVERLVRQMTWAGIGAAGTLAVAGLLRGLPLARVLRGAVALGVAALPEGLPVVSTAALVRTMQRMRARGMVVRRLSAAETLGGVTVICADKTGTLTRNEMCLELVEIDSTRFDARRLQVGRDLFDDPAALLLLAGLLNSEVELRRERGALELLGSSTERALVQAARAAGLDAEAERARFPLRSLRDRSVGAAYVITVHDTPGAGRIAFVKGAPDQVLGLCDRDGHGALDDARRRALAASNDQLAADGLRVLAFAWRRLEAGEEPGGGFTFLGLGALRDPLRDEAAEAVAAARGAGIRTLMLTGDQKPTAEAIARQVGLRGEALQGDEATRLIRADGPAVTERMRRVSVLARVTPADKLEVVRELQKGGDIVAMAGDGINDAPALKAADVGIAVGRGASDMARRSADVVLENEDLRSILAAVGEGRIVQDNLHRAIRYLIATNVSEIVLTTGAAIAGLPEPLNAMQLLWLNLVSDTMPALALALEGGVPEVLDRPPAPPGAPLLNRREVVAVARDGVLLAAAGAAGMLLGRGVGFGLLTGAELSYALVCRAPGSRPDRTFLGWLGAAAALEIPVLTIPPLRRLLGLPSLPSLAEVGAFGVGLVVPWATHTLLTRVRSRGADERRERAPLFNPVPVGGMP